MRAKFSPICGGMNMSDKDKEKEALDTLADFIAHPELYSCHVGEDLGMNWVIEKKKKKKKKKLVEEKMK